jgi:hypothetical protein
MQVFVTFGDIQHPVLYLHFRPVVEEGAGLLSCPIDGLLLPTVQAASLPSGWTEQFDPSQPLFSPNISGGSLGSSSPVRMLRIDERHER